MASEQLLKTTLALYHETGAASQRQQEHVERIYSSTATLLATLTNPHNISLLTTHFLTAPGLWALGNTSISTQACFRVISVYNTAAQHVHRHAVAEAAAARHGLVGAREDRRPDTDTWARAVAQGAVGATAAPRWRHLLALAGVLLGCEGQGRQGLSRARRFALEEGVVAAGNLALQVVVPTRADIGAGADADADAILGRYAVVLALHHAFPLLADHVRAGLRCDLMLPCVVDALVGPHGFDGGRALDAIATDPQVHVIPATMVQPGQRRPQLHWPETATSFRQLTEREIQPAQSLVPSAGPIVAALAVFAVERAATHAVLAALDRLQLFAQELAGRWAKSSVLSDTVADLSVEALFLSETTRRTTWPMLWQHLKKMLYAAAVLLQALMGRSVLDRTLAGHDAVAPVLAGQVLRTLSDLDFIAARDHAGQFQAYQFSYLAATDLLACYPGAAAVFLGELLLRRPSGPLSEKLSGPPAAGQLFYLNLAEHFAAVLSVEDCERLLLQPALPYVALDIVPAGRTPHTTAVFEAAHSAVLAVLGVPRNAPLAAALGPFYAEALLAAFPDRISSRQFRLAFATLVQILSPPFPVFATHPTLAETLLEMVRFRAVGASMRVLVPSPGASDDGGGGVLVSEQSVLVLTLIDALPFVALPVLEAWLTTTAEAVWAVGGKPALRQAAQQRFWEVLGSGEMDVERAARAVAWWGNGGGGALVLEGRRLAAAEVRQRVGQLEERLEMSGALSDAPVVANKL